MNVPGVIFLILACMLFYTTHATLISPCKACIMMMPICPPCPLTHKCIVKGQSCNSCPEAKCVMIENAGIVANQELLMPNSTIHKKADKELVQCDESQFGDKVNN